MAFTSPPQAPQRGDRTTFSSRTDAFLMWLVALIPQLNVFLATITNLAVGGANTFSFIFDTATADADPGTGKVRLGSSTQSSSVVLRLDSQAATGGDVTAFLTALQTGTSNFKGAVRLQRVNDPNAWLLFDISSIATLSGYFNLTVVPRASSGAAPFAKDDTLAVFFDKKGDRGDSGGTPSQDEIRTAIGVLDIPHGGTGATTADVARQNLGAKASGTEPVATGGTGATTAATALANLGGYPRSGGALTGAAVLIDGSQGAPAIGWGNATGFYKIADGQIGVVCSGVLVGKFTSAGFESIKITQTQ